MLDDPIDLLLTLDDARAAALVAAERGEVLDALLLVAGCSQVVEDDLHGSEHLVDLAAEHLTGASARPGGSGLPAAAAAGARMASQTRRRIRHALPTARRLAPVRDELLALAVELADRWLGGSAGGEPVDGSGLEHGLDRATVERADRLLGDGGPLATGPVPGQALLRLPSCYRSFDQHPADTDALVARFLARGPVPDRALVVGVRTSGSYLGPLAAAALRRRGCPAELVTLRPGERLDRSQRGAIARLGGGPCLVVDDPPVSGGAVGGCIDELVAAGLSSSAVVLALALPDGWELPPSLAGHRREVLWSRDWFRTTALAPETVRAACDRLLSSSGRRTDGPLRPVPVPGGAAPGGVARTPREHARAAYAVDVVGTSDAGGRATGRRATGRRTTGRRTLLVQGAGIGLFGRHDVAVAARLGDRVPEVLGVADGLLLQLLAAPVPVDPAGDDVPDDGADQPGPGLDLDRGVDYVIARAERLSRPVDRSEAMRGRRTAAEVGAQLVGSALGPADLPLRVAVVQPLVRRLLAVERPAVVDGRISADRWVPGAHGGTVKLDFGEGAFSNRDLWSYDPVLDLAALGDELDRAPEVRAAHRARTGTEIEPARWLLLRLVHAWDRHRHGGLPQPAMGRACAAALDDHVADLLLADLAPVAADGPGPWVALDLDGVVETLVLDGASAPGRAGGLALRTLVAHGHRVVLATGRAVDEVARRRAGWGLPAAVAEYGAVVVLDDGSIHDRRDADGARAVEAARAWLAAQDGVVVDLAHRFTVRAWRTGPTGRGRGPLSAEDLAGARAAAAAVSACGLDAVPGDDQTDLVPTGTTKAAAVRWLLDRTDPGLAPEPALAVGDGPADVELLELARRAVVPAHAEPAVRAAATVATRRRYQAGLAEGVAHLVGHRPGGCPTCAVDLPAGEAALLTASVAARGRKPGHPDPPAPTGPRGGPRRGVAVGSTAGLRFSALERSRPADPGSRTHAPRMARPSSPLRAMPTAPG